jgi:hypothetical protein
MPSSPNRQGGRDHSCGRACSVRSRRPHQRREALGKRCAELEAINKPSLRRPHQRRESGAGGRRWPGGPSGVQRLPGELPTRDTRDAEGDAETAESRPDPEAPGPAGHLKGAPRRPPVRAPWTQPGQTAATRRFAPSFVHLRPALLPLVCPGSAPASLSPPLDSTRPCPSLYPHPSILLSTPNALTSATPRPDPKLPQNPPPTHTCAAVSRPIASAAWSSSAPSPLPRRPRSRSRERSRPRSRDPSRPRSRDRSRPRSRERPRPQSRPLESDRSRERERRRSRLRSL